MIDLCELKRYENWLFKYANKFNLKKIDYSFKSDLLKKDLPILYQNLSHNEFLNDIKYRYDITTCCMHPKSLDTLFDKIFYENGFYNVIECERINNARYHKISRLKRRIEKLLLKTCFFVTLTFRDDVLDNVSEKTLREYVTRYLKNVGTDYVANVDYGAKNGRLHYHAIIQADKIHHKDWKYGAINFKKICYNNDISKDRLAKYISKLSNHALKTTNKRQTLIYPKKVLTTSHN